MSSICPPKYYVNIRQGGAQEPLKVLSATANFGTGTNLSLVAAVAGSVHRVLAYTVQCNSATQGTYAIKNGSGGSSFVLGAAPPLAGLPAIYPPWDAGYFETSVNTAIVFDITTAGMFVTLFYVTYVP